MYRAEIDGLRAIAVISVILYHAKIVLFEKLLFPGGFIGVDIFFVISGYLITRIILLELNETQKFNFLNFYERRARRILPVFMLVISITLPFAWQGMFPVELVDYSKSALSALLFVSNFFFYFSSTQYGADPSMLKPLLHTWSLGVEEQFYFIAPLLFVFLFKYKKYHLLILLMLFITSILFADFMNSRNPQFNFFSPLSRFWEILAGSIVAFVEVRRGIRKTALTSAILPATGIILIALSIVFFNFSSPHPSLLTLMPIIGTQLIIAYCTKEDLVGKALSSKFFVAIGLISYSLYLWHFPIFSFYLHETPNLSNFDKSVGIVLVTLLSVISYKFIEKPFRKKSFIRYQFFYVIIAIFWGTLVVINYNFISQKGYLERLPPILAKQNLDEKQWKQLKQNGVQCHNRLSNFCTEISDLNKTTVYSLGDSHLSALSPQLWSSAKHRFNYAEANMDGCPFALNVYKTNKKNGKNKCNVNYNNKRLQLISSENKRSIVIIGGRFPQALEGEGFDNLEGGFEGKKDIIFKSINDMNFDENIKNTVEKIAKMGHEVVLLYPVPEVGVHVPKFIYNQKIINFEPLTTSFNVYVERSKSTFEIFDSIDVKGIHRVYPHALFCNTLIQDRCVTHDDVDVFYADDDHPSKRGSEMIVELLMEKILEAEKNIRDEI